MGVIVAAPTAGGAGVLPAVLTGLATARNIADDKVVDALATAGLIGAVVAERASLSGAEGGCQAETGAAAGMAAGAATEMLGGTPSQVGHAVALAHAGHARPRLRSARRARRAAVRLPQRDRVRRSRSPAIEMALAGITFAIPVDEVIDVMGEIGREMDVRYRETAGGGLAATPTGRRLAKERLVQIKRGVGTYGRDTCSRYPRYLRLHARSVAETSLALQRSCPSDTRSVQATSLDRCGDGHERRHRRLSRSAQRRRARATPRSSRDSGS